MCTLIKALIPLKIFFKRIRHFLNIYAFIFLIKLLSIIFANEQYARINATHTCGGGVWTWTRPKPSVLAILPCARAYGVSAWCSCAAHPASVRRGTRSITTRAALLLTATTREPSARLPIVCIGD